MYFDDYEQQQRFHEAWDSVEIVRQSSYSLFTFGESELPYFVVCRVSRDESQASITRGEVRITRPMLITPDNAQPEFRDFFENDEEEGVVDYLLTRTARFSNLKFHNQRGVKQLVSGPVEAVVAKLARRLDDEEEDRTAILTAPPEFGRVAVLRYAAEQVWRSAPDNLQELRERGFLD